MEAVIKFTRSISRKFTTDYVHLLAGNMKI